MASGTWLMGRGLALAGPCILGALLFLISGMPAKAVPASATSADILCLVVGTRLAASSDQRQKLAGTMLAIYFLGRIDGRSPNADLQELLKRDAKKMTASELRGAASRCGTEFSRRGAEITRVGKTLEQLGK